MSSIINQFDDYSSIYPELAYYETDLERATYLQQLLINRCTKDGETNDSHYKVLREYFLSRNDTKSKLPSWVRTSRDLGQFWQYIKPKLGTYAERREFIWEEFHSLLDYLESGENSLHALVVEDKLNELDSEYIKLTWNRAIERIPDDPEGAITLSRTLLESALKYIADELELEYSKNTDLHDLYKMVVERLNLLPSQYTEKIFRQILGGCSAIVSGLGCLRNDLGDAHGKGKSHYKPMSRHAELAVNLSGSMCLFLLNTYKWNKENERL